MSFSLLDTHSVLGYIGGLTITTLVFLHPEKVTGFDELAGAYGILIGAVGVGAVAKGGQRRLQGGSVAPDTITPPAAPSKEQSGPLAPPTPKE